MEELDETMESRRDLVPDTSAVLAASGFASGAGSVLRSLAKLVIRVTLVVSDRVGATVSEIGEQLTDLVAEVQAERAARSGRPERHGPIAT